MKGNTIYIWASPHSITEQQAAELMNHGVLVFLGDLNPDLQKRMSNLQMEDDLHHIINLLIEEVQEIGMRAVIVQPAGSPAFQFALGLRMANNEDISVWYAHSERVSEDTALLDGSVEKKSVFQHKGWVIV